MDFASRRASSVIRSSISSDSCLDKSGRSRDAARRLAHFELTSPYIRSRWGDRETGWGSLMILPRSRKGQFELAAFLGKFLDKVSVTSGQNAVHRLGDGRTGRDQAHGAFRA